jgi:flagellar biosynthesis/type III secretory pathway chaperone
MTFKEELIEILKEELEVLHVLKELVYEKTDIIINNDIEKLEKLTKKEEEFINKMAIVEEKRLKLMDSWGVGDNISISDVIEKIPEEKKDLMEIKNRLFSVFSDIKGRNEINNKLINDNLQWLDFNMNLISSVQTPTTYGQENKGSGANNSLFDRKV